MPLFYAFSCRPKIMVWGTLNPTVPCVFTSTQDINHESLLVSYTTLLSCCFNGILFPQMHAILFAEYGMHSSLPVVKLFEHFPVCDEKHVGCCLYGIHFPRQINNEGFVWLLVEQYFRKAPSRLAVISVAVLCTRWHHWWQLNEVY